ncbi:hypothetical protein C7W93_15345 [Glaciimonas sp. PCH181]|nr:hypothetical protein C7W93_15345 [Glaciimonas sp. PCH181]
MDLRVAMICTVEEMGLGIMTTIEVEATMETEAGRDAMGRAEAAITEAILTAASSAKPPKATLIENKGLLRVDSAVGR